MAGGHIKKGGMINVSDVASSNSHECVACQDQPRGSNNLSILQPRYPQTVVHRFWDYPKAKAAWEWAFTIIHSLSDPPQGEGKKGL
jgi:hypothetical protein